MKGSLTTKDTIKVISGRLTCGDCIGLNRETLIGGSKSPCSKEGIKESHAACPKFKADVNVLSSCVAEEGNLLEELAHLTGSMSPKQLRVLGSALINEAITRKAGFQFYQRVFVRYRGTMRSNYLSNFMACRILSADKDTVRLCSDDGKVIFTYENTGVKGPSIYSVAAFEPLRVLMVKNQNVVDPDHERATSKALRAKEFEALGEIKLNTNGVHGVVSPEKVSKSNKGAGRKKRGSDIVDLTTIAREIEIGVTRAAKDGEEFDLRLAPNKYKRKRGSGELEMGDM